jgi:broad specificity phosphatase PhoE
VTQAKELARRLVDISVSAIYSSDLGRACQTARIIAARTGHIVQIDPRLREQDLGIFSGLTKAQIQQRHSVEYARYRSDGPAYIIPGGESAEHRAGLAVGCLQELAEAHRGKTIVVVCHEGVVRALLRHIHRQAGSKASRARSRNASITIFVNADGQWRVEALNDVRHLSGSDSPAVA